MCKSIPSILSDKVTCEDVENIKSYYGAAISNLIVQSIVEFVQHKINITEFCLSLYSVSMGKIKVESINDSYIDIAWPCDHATNGSWEDVHVNIRHRR